MSLPEELLVRILALSTPRLAPLLVSRQFFRIAAPLLYRSLHLRSPHHAASALHVLARRPALAGDVRTLVLGGIWHDCPAVLALCHSLQVVDVCLDAGTADPADPDAAAFCDALEQRHTIARLTIRKNPAVYLTLPRPIYVLQRLAQAVHRWPNLETVHFALRISSSPATIPLARALSAAPRLRVVRAQLPAVWNNLLLVISTNPHLEKIMLYAEPVLGPMHAKANQSMGSTGIGDHIEHAVLGTGLYMMEARKHARLSELVKAGTQVSIIRTRAHTTIATVSTQSAGGTPLGAVRAKEVAIELMADRDSFGAAVAQPYVATGRTYAQDV